MMEIQIRAGKGLFYMFLGQVLSLLTFIIPIVGTFFGLAGFVLSLTGIYILSGADSGYKRAFNLTLLSFVLNIVSVFFKTGILSSLIGFVYPILSFLIVYYICKTTGEFLQGVDTALVKRSELIWKIYAFCTIVILIGSLLIYVPIVNIIVGIINLIIGVVQLAAALLYMIFLWQSQKVLRR